MRLMAPCQACQCDSPSLQGSAGSLIVQTVLVGSYSHGRKQEIADSLGRKPFITGSSLGRMQEMADSLSGSQI